MDPNYEVRAPVDIAAFDKKVEKLAATDKSGRAFLDENRTGLLGVCGSSSS
jgi:hypothetical protein